MICSETTVSKTAFPESRNCFFEHDTLLLDIETTGLSAADHFIYCIGCASRLDDDIRITLFFAEQASQEKEILERFCQTAASFSKIITFNGTTFDIPFLRRRMERVFVHDPFDGKEFLDLYREVCGLKTLFRLENYRQKSVERFLGIDRDDRYSGGELISVYQNYTKEPDPDTLRILLQHNHDDILGMCGLLSILSYRNFLAGDFEIARIAAETEGQEEFLNVVLIPAVPFPQSVRIPDREEKILLDRDRALIRIPVRRGILKHYFPDYKNYYYLPDEDTVVHKSVGAYVDAAHRTKATRENCCVKKECSYLHLPVPGPGSYLRQNCADRDLYLDLSLFPKEAAKPDLPQELSRELRRFLLLLFQNL